MQLVRYLTIALLEPEWKAKSENRKSKNKKSSIIDYLKKCASKTMCHLQSSKDNRSLVLNTDIYNSKNIDIKKLTKSLGSICIPCTELNLFICQYVLKKIMHIGLEWYLYTSMQINHLCFYIQSAQEKHFFFFLHCGDFSANTVEKISVFFDKLKLSLRSIKCIVYKYIKHLINLFAFDYLGKNIFNYLFKCSDTVIENLVIKIKKKLYHKNKQGFWRANVYTSLHQPVLQVKEVLYLWRSYHSSILTKSQVLKINKTIDHMFYKWQMKRK